MLSAAVVRLTAADVAASQSATPAGPLSGTFADLERIVSIQIDLTGPGDRYVGQVSRRGTSYPLMGIVRDDQLIGTFRDAAGNSYGFHIVATSAGIDLTTDNTTFHLKAAGPQTPATSQASAAPSTAPATATAPATSPLVTPARPVAGATTTSVAGKIDARFRMEGRRVFVHDVGASGPAAAVGIKAGDELMAVDDVALAAIADLAATLRGSAGSEVKLSLVRAADGKPYQVRVVREP